MQRRSLIEYLNLFHRHGSQTAYVHQRGYRTLRWSYRQIAETACQFARELEARNISTGDRVLLWGENCAEWVVAFFGCVLRGAVVVPMDCIAAKDFVQRVAREVDAKLLVCSRPQARQAPALPVLLLETLPQTLARHSRVAYPSPELSHQDMLQIIFTSGTTADPKGVVLSHGNLLANLDPLETEIRPYLKYERLVHPIRFLNLVPLSHVFGQFLSLFVSPLLAGTVVFQQRLNPSDVLRTLKRERVSALVTVPRLLETLRHKIERDSEAAGRLNWFRQQIEAARDERFYQRWWRFRRLHRQLGWKFWAFVCGGATLDPDTETFWKRLGYAVVQGYGLTETTSLVSVNHPFKLAAGSIGKALPGRELKLDPGGEILVRGENIAAGYWHGRKLQPVQGREEWFHTGDLGALDPDGNLYFKGRKKSVIVTAEGLNIYPEDLEAALRRQPQVRDCVVVGLPRDGNEESCAVLLLRAAGNPEAIVQRANQSLAPYQHMRRWFLWPDQDFPRTSTHKPRTNLIREVVQAHTEQRAAAPAPPTGTLADLIARATGRAPARLSPDANLETDLNLSSIDRVELLSALEDRYQVELSETRFSAATTVGELEQVLHQPLARRPEYHYPRWPQRWPITWLRLAVYYLLTWPATLLLGYPKITGRRNLRGLRGPVLVICNHITSIDPGIILAALPARFRHRLAVAIEGEHLQALRRPPTDANFLRRWLDQATYYLVVALFNVFPLPQLSGFRQSFSFAGESVDRGYSVLVFPEGALTKDGKLAPFRAGVGLLASNLRLPIVPLRIDGLFELKQTGKKIARPGAVKVTIGSPLTFEPDTDPVLIARQLETAVASLG